ncbi:putative MATE family efflux protein [Cuneatibacter caecimuris]|uniref:Putative MATE family efflux protein n=2 Tax=Cuneatibacter caecimuris TaxID=1796618 RepID=A0A4Q7PII7_9FIRM|nr:putative MATE family efflux protein [Cuneatibacter caecimuris]
MRGSARADHVMMTEGNIWRHLVWFALPLLIGNVFQQFYNTVDSIIVGNFVGKEALAAVGSSDPVINTIIGFFSGMATGAGVVISQYFGARNDKNVHEAVHTTILMTFILSILFTVLGVLMVPPLLRMMGTPDDVFDSASTYLRIYFAGVIGLMFYNMGAGILRAVGDSKRPLYFLIFSAILNVLLDLLFVVVFRAGVAGVAYATIISQALSAVLILLTLTRETAAYRIVWKEIRLNKLMLGKIFRIGLPSALQMGITSFSNVFVQSYINGFGSACMAGWSSYGKIDKFCMLPIQSISLSVTTFVGQNLGAGQLKRAKKGSSIAFFLSIAVSVLMMIPIIIFAPSLVKLFNQEPDVVGYGTLFLRILIPFYLCCCANQVYAGSLRGAGDTKAPMLIMMGSFIVFRQVYLFIASRLTDSVTWIALGYPFGWLVCSVLIYLYYRLSHWEKHRITM